jgi:hypothetical protein
VQDQQAKASFSSALSAGCAAMNPVAAVSALAAAPPAERGALLLAMPPFTAAAALFKMDKANRERALASVSSAVAAADGAFARQHVLLKDHLADFFGGSVRLDGAVGGPPATAAALHAAASVAAADGEELLPPHFDTLLETAALAVAAVRDALPAPPAAGGADEEGLPDAARGLLDAVSAKAASLSSSFAALQAAVSAAQASHSDWRRLRILEQALGPNAAGGAAGSGPQLPKALELAPLPLTPKAAGSSADPFDLATLVSASRARILSRCTPAAAALFAPPPAAAAPAASSAAADFASAGQGFAAGQESPQFEWVRTPQGSWARQATAPVHLASRHPHLAVIAKKQLGALLCALGQLVAASAVLTHSFGAQIKSLRTNR